MADIKKLAKLKEIVAELQSNADKAQGALDRVLWQLKNEYDCDSVDDAVAILKKLRDKEEAAEKAFDEAMRKFEKKWGDLLT